MGIQKTLEEYGLKERHAKIYLACLALGSASVQKIAERASIARSTCEAVLDNLQKKGFVSSFRKKRTRYFSPEDPKKLVTQAKEKARMLEDALPQFEAIYERGNVLPTARLYQGEMGMKTVLGEILTEAKEMVGFGSIDEVYNVLGSYFQIFSEKRIEQKIPLRVILTDSPTARERQRLGPKQLREVRIFKGNYPANAMIFIWNNKMAMFSLRNDLVALLVESKELVDIQRTMFRLIWDSLPRYKEGN